MMGRGHAKQDDGQTVTDHRGGDPQFERHSSPVMGSVIGLNEAASVGSSTGMARALSMSRFIKEHLAIEPARWAAHHTFHSIDC